MEEIGRGAEAAIYHATYRGRDSIVKIRMPKGYRHPDLDVHLRNSRTKAEVRILRDARAAGVRTPVVYDVDGDKITMEHINGESVREILEKHPEKAESICRKIGETVAKLHSARIAHGDLTTSNMIFSNDSICLIDFSMGCTRADTEALGVDLRLLERAMASAHSEIENAFGYISEEYAKNMKNADEIFSKVDEIKSRARYT